MYIGPWQEFKLAKILQIKDKMSKEADEDNALTNDNMTTSHKAQSVQRPMDPNSQFRFKMDPVYQLPQKRVPKLGGSNYSEPRAVIQQRVNWKKRNSTKIVINQNKVTVAKRQGLGSGFNVTGTTGSTAYNRQGTGTRKGPASTNSKASYLMGTQNSTSRTVFSEFAGQLRRNKAPKVQPLPIDIHYD